MSFLSTSTFRRFMNVKSSVKNLNPQKPTFGSSPASSFSFSSTTSPISPLLSRSFFSFFSNKTLFRNPSSFLKQKISPSPLSTPKYNFPVSSIVRSFSSKQAQQTTPSDTIIRWVAPPKPAEHFEHPIYDLSKNQVGTIKLKRDLFRAPVRTDLIHRVVVWQLAKRRRGVAKAKNRAEVRGGGRKPWQQKKTGRARAGSIRSPLFRGGGATFGPRPRSYDYPLPKKVRKFALKCVLSARLAQGKLIIVDNFDLPTHKTSNLNNLIQTNQWESSLIFDASDNGNLSKAGLALPSVDVFTKGINVYSILLRDKLILTRAAVEYLEKLLTPIPPYPLTTDESKKE